MAAQASDTYQTFDPASLTELAVLLDAHRQAVLATLNPDSGAPYTAMTAYAMAGDRLADGFLVHLSNLSAHKHHLRRDGRASLIVFEPDDGQRETLQHRRVALDCAAEFLVKDSDDCAAAKERYLAKFPGHKVMFGLPDFDLIRLMPRAGILNAGFGRAYRVTADDMNVVVFVDNPHPHRRPQ